MLTAGEQRGEARTRRLQPQPQPAAPARRRTALPPAAAAPACGAGTRPRPPPALPTAPGPWRGPGRRGRGGGRPGAARPGRRKPDPEAGAGRAPPRTAARRAPLPALARPCHRNVRGPGPGAAPAPRSNKRHRATGAEAPAALLVRAASPRSQVARGEPSSGGTARATRSVGAFFSSARPTPLPPHSQRTSALKALTIKEFMDADQELKAPVVFGFNALVSN